MKRAILGSIATLPLLAAGVFVNPGSAEAAVFKNGSQLQVNADFKNTTANPFEVMFLQGNTPRPVGTYGSFGVDENSTDPFDFFSTAGATNRIDFDILSVDFTNPDTYLDKQFLRARVFDGGALIDDFQFTITEVVDTSRVGTTSSGIINISNLQGVFTSTKPTNSASAFGFLSGTFIRNNGTFAGTFEVAAVPEPASILGLGVVAGSFAMSIARKKNKA